jgi:translocation and assembly module TamB
VIRTAFQILIRLLVVTLALAVVGGLVLRAGGGAWPINLVVASLDPLPGVTIRAARAKGNVFSWLELRDVRLINVNGEVPLSAGTLRVRYSISTLIGGKVVLEEVILTRPQLTLRQRTDGSWKLLTLRRKKADSRPSGPPKIRIDSFTVVQGAIRLGLGAASRDSIVATVVGAGSLAGATLRLSHLEVRSNRSFVSASGALPLSSRGEVNLDVAAQPLAIGDLRFLSPRFDRTDAVALTLHAAGTRQRVAFRIDAPLVEGRSLQAEGIASHPKAYQLEYTILANARGFEPAWFVDLAGLPRRIDGTVNLDLTGPSIRRLSGPADIDLQAVPEGRVQKRRVSARAVFDRGRAQLRLQGDVGVASLRLNGWISPFDSIPAYDLSARVRPNTESSPAWVRRLLGHRSRNLGVKLVGQGFNPSSADFAARVTIDSAPGRGGLLRRGFAEVQLRGGSGPFRTVTHAGTGMLAMRGRLRLKPQLELWLDRGSVRRLDVAAFSGDSAPILVDADFNLRSRGIPGKTGWARANLDQVSLGYGSHTFDQGRMQLELDSGAVDVRATGRVNGDSVVVSAVAHPFLAAPSLWLRDFSFSRLELAALLGVDGEISGTARGRVAGRRLDQLQLQTTVSLAHSRIGKHQVTRATVDGALERGHLALKVNADAPAGRIELAGVGRPFDSTPSFTVQRGDFQGLDLGAILSDSGWHTSLAGSFEAEGSGKTGRDAAATGHITLRGSTVNSAAINGGRVEARLAGGRLELSGIIKARNDSLRIESAAYPFATPVRLSLAGAASVAAVAPFLGRSVPDAGGVAAIRVQGEWGSLDSMNLKGEIRLAGHASEVRLDSARTSFRLRGGMLTVDTLALRSNVVHVGGSGRLALARGPRPPSELRVGGHMADIGSLTTLLGAPRLGLDSGSFTASARGTREDLAIGLEVMGENLEVGARQIGAFHASLSGNVAGSSIRNGTADVVLERLPVGKTTVRTVRLHGIKEGTALRLRGEVVVDPERNLLLVSSLDPDSASLRLDTLRVQLAEDRWTLAHPVNIGYAGPIRVDDFSLVAKGRRITVDGVVNRRGEQRLHATVRALKLGRFADLLGAREVDGEINGTLDLSGPAAAPRVRGEVAFDMRARDKEVGTTRARIDWSAGGLLLDVGVRQKEGDSLIVKGRIPLAFSLAEDDTAGMIRPVPGGQLALDAVTPRFQLDAVGGLLNPETVQKLRGRLVMDAHAAGTFQAPRLSGDIGLFDASVHIPRLGAKYERGQFRVGLQGQEIRVTSAHLESGDGHLEAQGAIQLRSFPQAAINLDSRLSNFRVADAQEFRSSVSGKLTLSGAGRAPVLKGTLEVSNTDVYLQAKNLKQSAEEVELSAEDLRILERRFGQGVTRGAEKKKPLAAWDIELGLKLAENVWLRRHSDPVMAVELAGKGDVRKKPAEDLQIFGEIRPQAGRSFVQVVGRRFDVREGSVKLNGPLNQTAVALKAEYVAASQTGAPPVLITTAVRSDTGKLTVSLSSIPVLRAEDIMSYLTTGRPASTDPTLESDEQNALSTTTSLAVGAALGTVAGGAGQRLGLDVVQILQDRDGGQTLVAGKYVSAPLYLGFRQPIVASTTAGSSDTDSDLVEFEVEYAALRKLLLNFQGGGSEFRAFLRLRR